MSRFTAIAVNGAIQTVVTPGGNESLEITAEDNISPFVETVVTGGRLAVGFFGSGTVEQLRMDRVGS